jgi:SRSO17 transposase
MDGGSFPSVLQAMLVPFLNQLSLPQRRHFRWFVFGILMSVRSSKLSHVAKVAPRGGHRTGCGNFLRSHWDSSGILQQRAVETLRWMKPGKRDVLYVLIDDTRIEKRGRKMEAVSKMYDHKSQRFIHGHMVVTVALMFRGVVLPWKFEVWLPKDFAGKSYRKTTQMAADMIGEIKLPFECKVRVLFDAFYLAPCVVKACESRGFRWFSVASKNRKVCRKHCQKRSIKDFAPGVLRHHGKRCRLRRSRSWRWMRIASVDGQLGRLGQVRLALSKRPHDPWKKTLAVATNEINLDAREIIAIYEKRWNIEVMFKELRSSLGLADYQVLSRNAIERHLHLCGLSHQLLTHQSLSAQGAKARQEDSKVSLPVFAERLETLRQEIRKQQANVMLKTIKHREARKSIRAFLKNELQIAA